MSLDQAPRNSVLSRLSGADLDLIRADLIAVDLPKRHRLSQANVPMERVYFLESGIASIVARYHDEVPIEIGVIGREGLVNHPVIMQAEQSPNVTYMQLGGDGHSIDARLLVIAMAASTSLSTALLRHAHVFMMQMASTILANGRGTVSERLARWLTMAQDRTEGDRLEITHEFLAVMLGCRRPSVTVALQGLEELELVRRDRGALLVLDREGLIRLANGYYGEAEQEFKRLFAGPIHN